VWEEEVTLADMHPNPVVLERLHAAGQLATSRERVLLSGLPVHVLVSVQIQEGSAEATSYRGHCFVEPGPARDVWVDLLDAQFKRLSSPRGKNASLLINLCYEPKNALRSVITLLCCRMFSTEPLWTVSLSLSLSELSLSLSRSRSRSLSLSLSLSHTHTHTHTHNLHCNEKQQNFKSSAKSSFQCHRAFCPDW
jgi:hypothetical protein